MTSKTNPSNMIDVTVQSGLLKDIVEPGLEIAEEGITNFHWGKDQLTIRSVSPSNAIAVIQTIDSGAFDEYNVDASEGEEIVFGTKCSTISNLLRAADSEPVSLVLKNIKERMHISFSDVNYDLAGIDPETVSEPKVPELEYNTIVVVHKHVFERVNKVIGMISDSVNITIEESEFRIQGKGDADIAEIQVQVVEGREGLDERDLPNAAFFESQNASLESNYGSEYVDMITKFATSNILKLSIGEDYPLKVNSEKLDGDFKSEIIVAPRMDQN